MEDDCYHHAMADQIEQKILPKFRGLDPMDDAVRVALGEIRHVLKELRDELLIEALDQSSREHLFQWMGIDRQSKEVIAP
ncbi:MAG: hypothetical protein IH991_03830 [Planctomycetes bacterium]|nr:hypothetical protein [Planctomycetota bacterium]